MNFSLLYHSYKFSVYSMPFYFLSSERPLPLSKLGLPVCTILNKITLRYTDIYILNFQLFNSTQVVNLSIKVLFWNSSHLVSLNQKQNVNFATSKFYKDKKKVPKSCIISMINHFQLRHKRNVEQEEKKKVGFVFCFVVVVLKRYPQGPGFTTGFRRLSCSLVQPWGSAESQREKLPLCSVTPQILHFHLCF